MKKWCALISMFFAISSVFAIAGYERERNQRNFALGVAFAPTPEVSVPKPSPNDNGIWGFFVHNNSGKMIRELRFQHKKSKYYTTVNLMSDTPRYCQLYKLGFRIHGLRNGSTSKWRRESEKDYLIGRSHYTIISVPAHGDPTVDGVYLTVIWVNGTVKKFSLPYSSGDITINADTVRIWTARYQRAGSIGDLIQSN